MIGKLLNYTRTINLGDTVEVLFGKHAGLVGKCVAIGCTDRIRIEPPEIDHLPNPRNVAWVKADDCKALNNYKNKNDENRI